MRAPPAPARSVAPAWPFGVPTALWLAGDAAARPAAVARHFDGGQGYRAALAPPNRP